MVDDGSHTQGHLANHFLTLSLNPGMYSGTLVGDANGPKPSPLKLETLALLRFRV